MVPLREKNSLLFERYGGFKAESQIEKEKTELAALEKKKIAEYKKLKKNVTMGFQKRFFSDKAYFKDVFG